VRLWAVEDGRCLATLSGHAGRVLAVALDEARARVVSAGDDGTVQAWGLLSHGPSAFTVPRPAGAGGRPVAGRARILSASADRTVRAFEAEGGRLGSLTRLDAAVPALAVAPDGTVWAAHGTMVSALSAHPLHVPAAALCRPASAVEVEARASSVAARLEDARRSLGAGDLNGGVPRPASALHPQPRRSEAPWRCGTISARGCRAVLLTLGRKARLEVTRSRSWRWPWTAPAPTPSPPGSTLRFGSGT
jgi:hypothetical protein